VNQRRNSGEIINATLLEVFLSFVFVVLALAIFERAKAEKEKSARTKVEVRDRGLAGKLAKAEAERDSLRFLYQSQFIPKCDDGRPLLQIELVRAAEWIVSPTSSVREPSPSSPTKMTPLEFQRRFGAVSSREQGRPCKFVVNVLDSGGLDKEQFKEAMRVITSLFYQSGAYQRRQG